MKRFLHAAACLIVLLAMPALALAQGSAFTYQGLIKADGAPSARPVDLRFRLYSAATGGSQVGPQVTLSGVTLDAGVFSTTLDFGVPAYVPNAPRWLEIDATSAGGEFVTLAPRQALTAAPLALNMRGLVVDASNRVGIGEPTPPAPAYTLDVLGSFRCGNTLLPDAANTNAPEIRDGASIWQSFTAVNTGELSSVTLRGRHTSAWVGAVRIHAGEGIAGPVLAGPISISGPASPTNLTFSTALPPGVQVVSGQKYTIAVATPATYNHAVSRNNPYPGGISSTGSTTDYYFETSVTITGLVVTTPGRVGIGTTQPADALDVRGNIRLGVAGELQAAGGEEALRIVRGTVNPFTGVEAGSGFTAIVWPTGRYSITFDRPFSGLPTVTATTTMTVSTGVTAVRVLGVTPTSVELSTSTEGGPQNPSIHFIAVGPR